MIVRQLYYSVYYTLFYKHKYKYKYKHKYRHKYLYNYPEALIVHKGKMTDKEVNCHKTKDVFVFVIFI